MGRITKRGFTILLFCIFGSQAYAASIVGSRHDLDALLNESMMNGAYNDYNRVCVYCHTPHGANGDGGPLWNRPTPNDSLYTVYNSSTMDTSPGTPSTISLLCLSCHDGTIAMDNVINIPNSNISIAGMHQQMNGAGCAACHGDPPLFTAPDLSDAFLTTDLSDDHPISMPYPTAAQDAEFVQPPPAALPRG